MGPCEEAALIHVRGEKLLDHVTDKSSTLLDFTELFPNQLYHFSLPSKVDKFYPVTSLPIFAILIL